MVTNMIISARSLLLKRFYFNICRMVPLKVQDRLTNASANQLWFIY